mmetsp:Transcript_35709/g.76112  ORF Transcript_35709/g.76112 Transcript_35709/m.76112 type:complete len:319 (-) Transcript_35709:101-1057(-)
MGKVRVKLMVGFGPNKDKPTLVVLEPTFEALLGCAVKKFGRELKKKDWRMCLQDVLGTCELSKGDLACILYDDCIVTILEKLSGDIEGPLLSKRQKDSVSQLQWIGIGEARGRLAARGRPSPSQLAALHAIEGMTVLVSLLRSDEAGCSEIQRTCERLGVRWYHAPLDGLRAMRGGDPTPEAWDSLRSVYEVLDLLVLCGESVIVHCAAGLHRTGIYLYLLMRAAGFQPKEALEKIREMRPITAEEVEKKCLDHRGETIFTDLQHQGSRMAWKRRPLSNGMRLAAEQEDHSDGSETQDSQVTEPDNVDLPSASAAPSG